MLWRFLRLRTDTLKPDFKSAETTVGPMFPRPCGFSVSISYTCFVASLGGRRVPVFGHNARV